MIDFVNRERELRTLKKEYEISSILKTGQPNLIHYLRIPQNLG